MIVVQHIFLANVAAVCVSLSNVSAEHVERAFSPHVAERVTFSSAVEGVPFSNTSTLALFPCTPG
ncbi:hypothetical protein AMTR_s00031p00049980, partial [Amborella trichopoda]